MPVILGASFHPTFLADGFVIVLSLGLWLIALLLYGVTYVVACACWRELGFLKPAAALLWPIAAGIASTYISAFCADDTWRAFNEYFRSLGIPLLIILQFFLLVPRRASATPAAVAQNPPQNPSWWTLLLRLVAVVGGCVLLPLFFITNCVVLTVDWQNDPPAEMLAKAATSRINKGLAESDKWKVEVMKIEFGRKPAHYRREILYNVTHGRGQVIYNHSTVYARGSRGSETRYWKLDISAEGLVPFFRERENERDLAGNWLPSEHDPGQVPMY